MGIIFINQYKDPVINQPSNFMERIGGFFFVAQLVVKVDGCFGFGDSNSINLYKRILQIPQVSHDRHIPFFGNMWGFPKIGVGAQNGWNDLGVPPV